MAEFCGAAMAWPASSDMYSLSPKEASFANVEITDVGRRSRQTLPLSAIFAHPPQRRPNQALNRLLKLALSGDQAALAALTEMATYLGRGIRMLISGLDPKEIVIVGDVTAAWPLLAPVIDIEIRRNSLSQPPILRCTSHGDSDAFAARSH